MKTNLMANLTWKEYKSRVPRDILILPIGSTEQHGPHLPLGVDAVISNQLALLLADRTESVVAPVISYGYKAELISGGGPLFPGTIDLSGATFTALVYDILREFLSDGWQKIFVLNGHFENGAFIGEAADLIMRNQGTSFPKIVVASWWDNISPELMGSIFDQVKFPGWELEHAAVTETSLMMHFTPGLVRRDQIIEGGLEKCPSYQCFPSCILLPESGALYGAHSGSPEKGRLIAEDVIKNFVALLSKEFTRET